MHFVGEPTECHICGKVALTATEKCKLCCDGVEHQFCHGCSTSYREFRKKVGTPEGKAAFEQLLATLKAGAA